MIYKHDGGMMMMMISQLQNLHHMLVLTRPKIENKLKVWQANMLWQRMLITNCHEVNAFIVIQTVLLRRLESRLTIACTYACMFVCCNQFCYFAMDFCKIPRHTRAGVLA